MGARRIIGAVLAGAAGFFGLFAARRAQATSTQTTTQAPNPIPGSTSGLGGGKVVPIGVPSWARPVGAAGGRNPISGPSVLSSPTYGSGGDALALRLPTDRWQPPARADVYLPLIRTVEARYGLPRNLLAALLMKESSFNPNATNPSGAKGIAQVIPRWHPELGEDGVFDPERAIPYAGRLLRSYRDSLGSWELALAAYNRGITITRREGLNNLPAETAAYIPFIMSKVG